MSGDRAADVWFIVGVAIVVLAVIGTLCWLADREVTRGRRGSSR